MKRPSVLRRLEVPILVASETILVRHPLRVEDLPYLMGLMTIHTCRQRVRLFFPELSAYHFAVYNLDLRVTFRAGLGNVAPGNRRRRISVRKN